MENSELIFYTIKLILGGIAAFLAILLWSKTKDGAWMSIICGTVLIYGGTVYNLLIETGILSVDRLRLFGLPLTSLIFSTVPYMLFILGLILMLRRTK